MNSSAFTSPLTTTTPQRVEFFRLPAPGKRDAHFGLSRGWYYKAADLGEIKMISVRQRNAMRGVRLVVYDSVADYIRRSMTSVMPKNVSSTTSTVTSREQLSFSLAVQSHGADTTVP